MHGATTIVHSLPLHSALAHDNTNFDIFLKVGFNMLKPILYLCQLTWGSNFDSEIWSYRHIDQYVYPIWRKIRKTLHFTPDLHTFLLYFKLIFWPVYASIRSIDVIFLNIYIKNYTKKCVALGGNWRNLSFLSFKLYLQAVKCMENMGSPWLKFFRPIFWVT